MKQTSTVLPGSSVVHHDWLTQGAKSLVLITRYSLSYLLLGMNIYDLGRFLVHVPDNTTSDLDCAPDSSPIQLRRNVVVMDRYHCPLILSNLPLVRLVRTGDDGINLCLLFCSFIFLILFFVFEFAPSRFLSLYNLLWYIQRMRHPYLSYEIKALKASQRSQLYLSMSTWPILELCILTNSEPWSRMRSFLPLLISASNRVLTNS